LARSELLLGIHELWTDEKQMYLHKKLKLLFFPNTM